MPQITAQDWETCLDSQYPEAHLLQSAAWGALKADFGWEPVFVRQDQSAAMLLLRKLPLGFHAAYLPRGPLGQNWQKLWPEVDQICRDRKAVFLKVEPDLIEPLTTKDSVNLRGFTPGAVTVQPPRTLVISLQGTEDEWLAQMKQKTRYNVRLAGRKGIVVKPSQDLDTFYAMMQVTGERDGFGVHSRAYYRRAYELFSPDERCVLLMAEFEGKPLAGLMIFRRGPRAWYFYGASTDEERSRMPTYLLQWEAMRWAAAHGCTEYDLYGVPDAERFVECVSFQARFWRAYYSLARRLGKSL
jgi:lipid II:glycine glycyltransferase (peptidoglycan interpeptide bridge formation enzyme)